jgi:hypothetical protein
MSTGKMLMIGGVVLFLLGVIILGGERLGLRPGRLPGDVVVRGERWTFAFPIMTCIVLSAAVSLALWLIRSLRQ